MSEQISAKWRFAAMQRSQVNQDPVHGEFFVTEELTLPMRLVRESIQNSLDAKAPNSDCVQVIFKFSGSDDKSLSRDVASKYLTDLKDHLDFVGLTLPEENEDTSTKAVSTLLEQPMPFLVIEDFGTTGLKGNIQADSPMESGNDFWGLFRSVGISPKSNDSGGSWGLGKWVFPDASRINSFLGMTYRGIVEEKNLLMGMTVLKTHVMNDRKYPPYGWYARSCEQPDETWFPMPINSDDEIESVCLDFDLAERIYEQGLSIIIPYPNQNLTPGQIAYAAMSEYFLPIVRGDLKVRIIDEEKEDQLVIDSNAITTQIDELIEFTNKHDDIVDTNQSWSLKRAVDLATFADKSIRDKEFIPIDCGKGNLNTIVVPDLENVRAQYERGDSLAFGLRIEVERKKTTNSKFIDEFFVFIKKDDDLTKGLDFYVRGNIRIPNMSVVSNYQVMSLVYIDGTTELGHMLRDAEGPSHDKWNDRSQRLLENWVVGNRVKFVKNSVLHILSILHSKTQELQFDTLAFIFPDQSQSGSKSRTTKGDKNQLGEFPRPHAQSPFSIARHKGGRFSVRLLNDIVKMGSTWKLRFAYGLAYGTSRKPFTVYKTAYDNGYPDFMLENGSIHVETKGCVTESSIDNEIEFTIHDRDFKIEVSGFDDRDLTVVIDSVELDKS